MIKLMAIIIIKYIQEYSKGKFNPDDSEKNIEIDCDERSIYLCLNYSYICKISNLYIHSISKWR